MLHTHDDFLRAIEAEPGDRTRRLVVADWLDERSDPRGELIRVEEEMRTLPVFSDHFWELKPRRNELRAAVGPEWCGRMRYGTECEPVFRHGIPDGWRERWRLIREFTERWHRIPMPDVGGRQKEIAEAEARLGRTLPPSVREWIAFTNDIRLDDHRWRELRVGVRPEHVPGYDAVAFSYWPDGSGAGWDYVAVRYADLSEVDPPGYFYSLGNGSILRSSDGPVIAMVSWYALKVAAKYAGNGGTLGTDVEQPTELIQELDATFPPSIRVEAYRIYEAENLIVWVWPRSSAEGISISVAAAKPLEPSQIPAGLWAIVPSAWSRHGIFASQQS
jgi:uncharacterized protein (TIGR02996 family)